jgi:organic hydroperoxide reductase OsmC/OhrA
LSNIKQDNEQVHDRIAGVVVEMTAPLAFFKIKLNLNVEIEELKEKNIQLQHIIEQLKHKCFV